MINYFKKFLIFAVNNFGPMMVFFMINRFFGLKIAIIATLITTVLEVAYKIRFKKEFTTIFKFTLAMTFVFGAVDLYLKNSMLFKYEATFTNVITGLFFGSTLFFGKKAIIQDFYEKTPNAKPITPVTEAYFKLLTKLWVLYFFMKAAAYSWVAGNYTIEQGFFIRMLLGTGSFYLMMFFSTVVGRKMWPMLKKWGLLPNN